MTSPPVAISSGSSWLARALIVNVDTGTETEVGVISASVTVDRKSDARRVVEATITPDVDPKLLVPPHRLKLSAGYAVGGVEYYCPLANVRMGDLSRGPFRSWSISGALSDESLVAAAKFTAPRKVDGGRSMLGLIRDLIIEAVPGAEVKISTGRDGPIPGDGMTWNEDRWAAIAGREESMATALGVDVGIDAEGAFVVRDPPSAGPSDWHIDEGELLVDYTEKTTAKDVRNVVVAHSDHPDTDPVRSIARDTDPASPTRVSRWGQAVLFYSSPLLTSEDMAAKAAATRLANSRGLTVSLDLSGVPNPWADITDLVYSRRAGVITGHVLDRVTLGLLPDGAMTLTAAARTVSIT